jgi:hypothetical protein
VQKLPALVPPVLLAITMGACGDILNEDDYELDRIEARPSIALPIAFGELSIQDLLNSADSANVGLQPDGLVFLRYEQTLKSQSIRNLIDIPNVPTLTQNVALPAGTYPSVANDILLATVSQNVTLGLSPEQLTEISFREGTLNFEQSFVHPTNNVPNNNFRYGVRLVIPQFIAKSDGSAFNREIQGSGGATTVRGSIPLSDYIFRNTANPNRFVIQYTFIIKRTTGGTGFTIASNTQSRTNVSFTNLNFTYIRGFFGDQSASVDQERIEIGAFGTSLNGAKVSLAQPEASFEVINGNGVPVRVQFTTLQGEKTGRPPLPITLNPPSPVNINFPTVLGNSASTTVAVANVKAMLDYAPTTIVHKITARINAGLTSGANFLADTSTLRVKMNVKIPLWGNATGIVLADTFKTELDDLKETEVEKASIRVKINNEIPLNGNLQFFFTDENYNVLDSLLAPSQKNLIPGSTVNATGELQSAGTFDQSISLDKDKIDVLFKSKKMIVKIQLTTSPGPGNTYPDVKFLSTYKIKLNLGVLATLKLSADL